MQTLKWLFKTKKPALPCLIITSLIFLQRKILTAQELQVATRSGEAITRDGGFEEMQSAMIA
ncbi:hypothetical protein [Chlorobium limicola]|uniref:Uncharacterized protein n=1 Tax=Chlorobium limicola TaxID=1092 RepID=A0A101JA30_CHLLI|nr:hypothetical protein [Chlorobium limicola]KUL23008.1 hypothetical protein ASB62_07400 [Chlorobium limicola]